MNYTLHQLQIFLKIAQLKSITKAAAALHLTQPAVSIQLKNFQDQFAIPLTEVVGRKLYITNFGNEISVIAQNIIDEVNTINHKTLAFQGKLSGRLNLSVASTGKYVMPYFLSGFMGKHPGLELQMDVTNKLKVVEDLEANTTDFALVSVLPDKLDIDYIPLMENKLFFIGSSQLNIGSIANTKDLVEKFPLIYREHGSATRKAMEDFINRSRFSGLKKIELTSNEAVKQAVISGLGCSIMPLIGLKNELKNGDLQIIPVKGMPVSTMWHLIWLKAKNLSPAAIAYLEYVNTEKNNIIKTQFNWVIDY